MDRNQDAAVFDAAFVTLGFILRNAHADQRADEAARRAADTEPGQRAHDRTRRDERSKAGDGERADAGKQAQRSAHYSARGRAGAVPSGALVFFSVASCCVVA